MNKKELIIKLVNNEFSLNDLITIYNSYGYKLLIYLNDDEYIDLTDEYNNSK